MSKLTKLLTPLDKQKDDSEDIFPKKPFNFGLIASKGAGKTTLLLNLLSKKGSPLYKRYDMIFLISPTAHNDDKMKDLVEDIEDQYYNEMTPEVLEEILEKMKQYKQYNQKKKNIEFCIIYDDCIHMLKQKNNNKKLSEIFTQNRHHKLSNIILVQKWTGYLPTIIRSNLDCLAIWKTQNKKEEQSLLDEIGDPDELKIIYDIACSEPYDFLYINQYVPNRTRYYKRFDLLFQNY